MIFEDLLFSILDFVGFSQFSIPLSFIDGFAHIMARLYQLNGFLPVFTALKNVLLILKFTLLCGVVKMIISKIF